MKYVSLVLLGLLMAVLAGCGGGGDGGKGDKILELEAELADALSDLSTTERTLKTTQGELSTTKGTLSTTQDELKMTKDTLSTAQETLSATQGQLSTTQGELKTTQGQLSATQGELETTKDSLTITQDVLETTQDELKTTRDTLSTTKTQLETAQKDLASKETTLDTLLLKTGVETVTALSAQLDTYKTLQNQVDALLLKAGVETLPALSTKLDTDDDAYDDLQTEVQGVLTATGTTTLAALQTAYTTARKNYTDLNAQVQAALTATNSTSLTALQTTVAGLRIQVTNLSNQVATLTGQVKDAQDTANQQVQDLQANQRALNFKKAFTGGTVPDDLTDRTAKASPVIVTVPTSSSLKLERGTRYRSATLSGSGIRKATMALTSGGDSGKTVVYTDRELSRQLLGHYADTRDAADTKRLQLATPVGNPEVALTGNQIPVNHQSWKISHGVSTTLAGVHVDDDNDPNTPSSNDDNDPNTTDTKVRPADPANPSARTSYSGSLHGVPGTYVCGGSSGSSCKVQLAPTYAGSQSDSGDSFALQSVTLSSVGGTGLFFKPSSPSSTIKLYQGGPVGPDTEYMVFGYWREDPASAAGTYQFDVFAQAIGTNTVTFPDAITAANPATYDGIAVGAYVEQDPNDPIDTHRQGEFTADVFLTATSADAVTGTIDDFVATPTGGSAAPRTSDRWVITLNDNNNVELNLAGGGAATDGNWTHAFVPHHANTVSANQTPPAVTGIFEARIVDFVHILGAYGAKR